MVDSDCSSGGRLAACSGFARAYLTVTPSRPPSLPTRMSCTSAMKFNSSSTVVAARTPVWSYRPNKEYISALALMRHGPRARLLRLVTPASPKNLSPVRVIDKSEAPPTVCEGDGVARAGAPPGAGGGGGGRAGARAGGGRGAGGGAAGRAGTARGPRGGPAN